VPTLPRVVWWITLLAVATRLLALLVLGDAANPGAMEHHNLARSLLQGTGFSFNETAGYADYGYFGPSSVQSPPYPFFLATLYAIFGVGSAGAYWAGVLVNVLFAGATVPLLYLLVRRLGGRDEPGRFHLAGLLACGLFAIWPTQIIAVTQLQVIIAITWAFVAVAYLWQRSLDTQALAPWIAYGLIGCLAALAEPVLLPPMALSGVWVLLTRQLPWPIRLRNGAILLACAFVIIGPWTWRNYRVHDAFMPIKSTFWVNVWKGNNGTDPGNSGTDRPTLTAERLKEYRQTGRDDLRQYSLLTDADRAALAGMTPVETEEYFGHLAKTWISENPGSYAKVSGKRLLKTLWWDWDHPRGHEGFYVYPISRMVLLLGTLAALPLALRARWRLGYLGLVSGLALLTYTLTVTAARFAMPMEPYQFALIGLLLATLLRRRRPA
jgi:hypothetical protein